MRLDLLSFLPEALGLLQRELVLLCFSVGLAFQLDPLAVELLGLLHNRLPLPQILVELCQAPGFGRQVALEPAADAF